MDGIDMSREAYRISFEADGGTVRGYVPEGLVMQMLSLNRRPGHQQVYEWLADNSAAIEAALTTLSRGKGPTTAPFDRLSLAEEI
ncbi:MAG: hypothetical protein KJN93_04070 [Alphaproteobacteria bacterium]|nr:hypothetical protein [Alphaproteobacteria bacterium]